MHSALRIQNVSNLPLSVRRLATAAMNGSIDGLSDLEPTVAKRRYSRAILLLPVFYFILNPAKIPTTDERDHQFAVEKVKEAAAKGLLALSYIFKLHIPPPVFPELWPRVWKWISFLTTQPHGKLNIDAGRLDEDIIMLFLLFGRLHHHPGARKLIHQTPGVAVYVGSIWKMFLRPENITRIFQNHAFTHVCDFLYQSGENTASKSAALCELIEETGGDLHEFSLLVIRHLGMVITEETMHPDKNPTIIFTVICMLRFLIQSDIRETPFLESLAAQGLGRTLTCLIPILELFGGPAMPRAVEKCCVLLEWTFAAQHRGYQRVLESLHAGLLRAIASGRDNNRTCITIECLRSILHETLPVCMVYYTVLHHMKAFLDDPPIEDQLKKSTLYHPWRELMQLARERIRLLNWFDLREFESSRGCDNAECSAIRGKSELRRCSRCLSVYYCSKTCQSSDWKNGFHRQLCFDFRIIRLGDNEDRITTRDRSFMRALMQDDYEAAKEEIFLIQIAALTRNPDQAFFLVFDYTQGPVSIEVQLSDVQFKGTLREKAAENRVEQHLMLVQRAPDISAWLLPMRSSSSMVRQELKKIARKTNVVGLDGLKLNECPPGLRDDIRKLAEAQTASVEYIH